MTTAEQHQLSAAQPWPGLESFQEGDSQWFFGRDAEIKTLREIVLQSTTTVLFAQSGHGKTSLLRAGLFPALRRRDLLPIYIRLDHSEDAGPPIEQVWRAIERELPVEDDYKRSASGQRRTLWEWIHDRRSGLCGSVLRGASIVLVFDQFEEIYTLGDTSADEHQRFMAELADVAEQRPPLQVLQQFDDSLLSVEDFDFAAQPCRVVVALREDYLWLLDQERGDMPSLMHNRVHIDRLSGAQAFDAVMKPAPGLVEREVAGSIIRLVCGLPEEAALVDAKVEPAYLSLVCRLLNDLRLAETPVPDRITMAQFKGHRDSIFADYYERCINVAVAPEKKSAREFVEEELLTPSNYRDSVALVRAQEAVGLEVIAHLIGRRLLHVDQRGELQRVELTHDVLVKDIARSRDQRHERQERDAAVKRAEAERAQKNKALRWAFGASLLAVMMLVLAVFAVQQWQEAVAAKEAEIHARAEAEASEKKAVAERKNAQASEQKAVTARAQAEDERAKAVTARNLEAEARERADKERASAVAARAKAEDLINYMLFDLRDRLEPLQRSALLDDVANKAADYFANQPKDNETDAQRRNRGGMYHNRGMIDLSMGRHAAALEAFTEFQKIMGQRAKESNTPDRQSDLAVAYHRLGLAHEHLNSLAAAASDFDASLSILNALLAADKDNTLFKLQAATTHEAIGDLLRRSGKSSEAAAHYQQSLDLVSADSKQPGQRRIVAILREKLGDIQLDAKRPADALLYYDSEVAAFEQLVTELPDDLRIARELAIAVQKQGIAQLETGKMEDAGKSLARSIELFEKLHLIDPRNVEVIHAMAAAHQQLGRQLSGTGKVSDALRELARSKAFMDELLAGDAGNILWQVERASTCFLMGEAQLREGHKDSVALALKHFEEGSAVLERLDAAGKLDAQGKEMLSAMREGISGIKKMRP